MERRKFIKVTTTASLASVIAGKGFSSILEENELAINQQLVLKGFKDEQEEYPSLVTDGEGNMWIYSLNRKHYPENAEVISAFHFNGKELSVLSEKALSALRLNEMGFIFQQIHLVAGHVNNSFIDL